MPRITLTQIFLCLICIIFSVVVCLSIDIRNKLSDLTQLEDCTVIEGSLQILLIEQVHSSDSTILSELSFPRLYEITDYLLLYRVSRITTLNKLFPNLAVIRGQKLFSNYALVAFEMPDLEDLGLGSLTKILRGAVRLEKNPNLCYLDTIDWLTITGQDPEGHFIMQNKAANQCSHMCPPGNEKVAECPSDPNYSFESGRKLCWNSFSCQNSEYRILYVLASQSNLFDWSWISYNILCT